MELHKTTKTIYHGMKNGKEYLSSFDHSDYDIYGGFYGDCTLLRVINDVPCILAIEGGLYEDSRDVYVRVEHYYELYMSLEEILKKNLIDKIIK